MLRLCRAKLTAIMNVCEHWKTREGTSRWAVINLRAPLPGLRLCAQHGALLAPLPHPALARPSLFGSA